MIPKNYRATYAVVVVSILITASCNESSTVIIPVQGTSSAMKKGLANGRIVNYTFDGTEGDPIDLTSKPVDYELCS